jgi:type IV secretory pathway VirB10-like protein
MSSGSEDEGSRTPSDYDPEGEPDLSPKRPPVPIPSKPPQLASSRAKKAPRTKIAGSSSRAAVPPSPSGSVNGSAAAQAQAQAFHQAGYMMPAMGPGGIPIMMPPGGMGNERAQLYTLLRQLPMGAQGPGPAGLPFPFPM